MLAQGCGKLELKKKQVALILDASESAQPYRDSILRLTSQILERLPRSLGKKIYFLGNAQEYDSSGLARNGNQWWQENSLRGSLLTPTLESLKTDSLLLIGAGTVFDYPDWAEKVQDRLIVAGMGDQPMTTLKSELKDPDFSQLLPLLHDPVLSIEIKGTAFMPYYWDNGSYHLAINNDGVSLASEGQKWDISLWFWGSDVRAAVHTRSGSMELPLQPVELEQKEGWRLFSTEEAGAFRQAAAGQDFICPVCGREHTPATLRCTASSSILGSPVYPALAKAKGIIIISTSDSGMLFRVHPVNVLKLGEERCLVVHDEKRELYGYNGLQGKWCSEGEVPAYYGTGEGYVLVM